MLDRIRLIDSGQPNESPGVGVLKTVFGEFAMHWPLERVLDAIESETDSELRMQLARVVEHHRWADAIPRLQALVARMEPGFDREYIGKVVNKLLRPARLAEARRRRASRP